VPQAAQAVAHAGLLLVVLRRLGGLTVRRFALGAAAQALGAHVVAEVGVLAVAHGGVAAPRAVLGGEGPGLLRALTGQEGAVVDRICAATQLLHPLGAEVGHDLVAVGGLGPVAGLLDHPGARQAAALEGFPQAGGDALAAMLRIHLVGLVQGVDVLGQRGHARAELALVAGAHGVRAEEVVAHHVRIVARVAQHGLAGLRRAGVGLGQRILAGVVAVADALAFEAHDHALAFGGDVHHAAIGIGAQALELAAAFHAGVAGAAHAEGRLVAAGPVVE